jgi:hypothetical protein
VIEECERAALHPVLCLARAIARGEITPGRGPVTWTASGSTKVLYSRLSRWCGRTPTVRRRPPSEPASRGSSLIAGPSRHRAAGIPRWLSRNPAVLPRGIVRVVRDCSLTGLFLCPSARCCAELPVELAVPSAIMTVPLAQQRWAGPVPRHASEGSRLSSPSKELACLILVVCRGQCLWSR